MKPGKGNSFTRQTPVLKGTLELCGGRLEGRNEALEVRAMKETLC